MAKKTSEAHKPRTVGTPLEIWRSADGEWEWRVLNKKSDSIWECAVKSPGTFGSWEYGDVYAQTVTENERTFVDLGFGSDYFVDLIPIAIGSEIAVPDPSQPRTLLPLDKFSFLCEYFTEDGMSFHCSDAEGSLLFFFNTPLEDCPVVMTSQWGIEYGEEQPGKFHFDLVVYDQPEDPLTIPFFFNATDEKHRYEMSQLVEQESLPFFALARQGQSLGFYDSLSLKLPDDLRHELAPVIRDSLLRASVPKGV